MTSFVVLVLGTKSPYVGLTGEELYVNSRLNLFSSFCLYFLSPDITLVHQQTQLFMFWGDRSQLVEVGLKFSKKLILALHFFSAKLHHLGSEF